MRRWGCMEALKCACSLKTIALRKECRSRRFGRFNRRRAFLPDCCWRGVAAFRVGAGPMDVVATHVAATAFERVREDGAAVPSHAKELAGIVVGFKIHGTLWNLAAIEKIRHPASPPCHRGDTNAASSDPPATLADQRPRLVALAAPPRGVSAAARTT